MTFGLLFTSIGSGQLINRWGRYKPFPIAVMAVGPYLLSRMGPATGMLIRSSYMLIPGLGLRMVMQVLILAIQNAVNYQNLGAATSAATFFRSVGGSFGWRAIFGTILRISLAATCPATCHPAPPRAT